jgi:Flp pilus assembly protein TadB
MIEEFPDKGNFIQQIELGHHPERLGRPGKLQRIKLFLFLFLGLGVLLALLTAVFIVGLILAVPLMILSVAWFGRIAWRVKRQSHLRH